MPNQPVIDMTCPWCRRENEIASGMNNATVPTPGSVSICWLCQCVAVFADSVVAGTDLYLRKPTQGELFDIMADPDVRQALQLVGSSRTPHEARRRFV